MSIIFKKIFFAILCLFLFLWLIFLFDFSFFSKNDIQFGVTFSTRYATYLGLDWKDLFQKGLNELGIRHFRIPVYWPDIEPSQGQFVWDDLDWIVTQADQSGAEILLAIGQKVPRWPECYIPSWAIYLSQDKQDEALLNMLDQVVNRYKSHLSVKQWQIENEPFFSFGSCPKPRVDLIEKEIAQVRRLDNRPIVMTVSGELESWGRSAKMTDILGISIYRKVFQPNLGSFPYPIPALFYRLRSLFVFAYHRPIIVTEFQMEPWLPKAFDQFSLQEREELFSLSQFKKNISYIRRTGFSEVYLWGFEWWYAEKLWGNDSLWNEAKILFP